MSFELKDRELGIVEPEVSNNIYNNQDNDLISLEREFAMIRIADKLIYKSEP